MAEHGDCYLGRDEIAGDSRVYVSDGSKEHELLLLSVAGSHGVSWPGHGTGNLQLAASLLYDLLDWIPSPEIWTRLQKEITSELEGDFRLPVSELRAWWSRQPEYLNGLIYFVGALPPLMDHRMLEAHAERCRRNQFATYLPHQNVPNSALSPIAANLAHAAALKVAKASVAYIGNDGANGLVHPAPRVDVLIVGDDAPADIAGRASTAAGAAMTQEEAREQLIPTLRRVISS